jgi:hypothetical protein|tara:strand:- start:1335 stop:1541 length:207 start_codon:yes stop_codon:yes gene_type:complete
MFYKNLIERAVLTGIQSYLGMMGADQMMTLDMQQQEMALAAGIGAALSVVKSAIASKLGAGTADLLEK